MTMTMTLRIFPRILIVIMIRAPEFLVRVVRLGELFATEIIRV